MFAWSLFVGSFLDKFAGGSMILLVNCILGDMIFIGMYFFNIHFYSLGKLTYAVFYFCNFSNL